MGTTALFVLLGGTGIAANAQERETNREERARFDDHDQQAVREWYDRHRESAPRGFREEERLSREDEGRLREGEVLDRDFRRHVHAVPSDLARHLRHAPPNHRYVVIGGHVVLIDNGYHVRSVIHLHD